MPFVWFLSTVLTQTLTSWVISAIPFARLRAVPSGLYFEGRFSRRDSDAYLCRVCSVEGGWPLGMRGVLEHVLYLVFGHARDGELGQCVARKKCDLRRFKAGRGFAADQIA